MVWRIQKLRPGRGGGGLRKCPRQSDTLVRGQEGSQNHQHPVVRRLGSGWVLDGVSGWWSRYKAIGSNLIKDLVFGSRGAALPRFRFNPFYLQY